MATFNIAGITESLTEADGTAAVIWFQGCDKGCKGCHNPTVAKLSWGEGPKLTFQQMTEYLTKLLDWVDWIVMSGGEPLLQKEAVLELAKWSHEKGKKVWVYTGEEFEQVPQEIKDSVDVLKTGRFVLEQKTTELPFRGSANQNLWRKENEGKWQME